MPITDEQRIAVIAEARTWFGTKYEDRQCLKGIAADCATFPLKPYQAVGLIDSNFAIPEHDFQWFMHKQADGSVDEKYIKSLLSLGMREIDESEVKTGDYVLFLFGVAYGHGAIIASWPDEVIHCFGKHGGVCSMNPNTEGLFSRRPRKFFTFA
jgi:hypothetical protein